MTDELIEVASECIETEVDTDDMLILEPLRDHNYTSSEIGKETNNVINLRTYKATPNAYLKKLPKITKLMALYNCKLCGYSTMKKDVIEAHKETHKNIKPGTKYKPCDSCNVNKNTPIGYHKCPKCSYTAKSMSNVRVHMRVHAEGTAYKCSECSYLGKDLQDLVNHYKTAKNFCDLCTFSSHLKNKLLAHKRLHNQGKQLVGYNLISVNSEES